MYVLQFSDKIISIFGIDIITTTFYYHKIVLVILESNCLTIDFFNFSKKLVSKFLIFVLLPNFNTFEVWSTKTYFSTPCFCSVHLCRFFQFNFQESRSLFRFTISLDISTWYRIPQTLFNRLLKNFRRTS